MKEIWTIGHSTHTFEEFIEMLNSFKIDLIVDIRSFPGSRKFPQYNKETLEVSMPENKIEYIHLKSLGGRRKPNVDSLNMVWRHPSFRAYADYMETESFANAAAELAKLALEKPTAIMCSEAVWWRCHRSMVSDYFKAKGWEVRHIMALGKTTEHPYTAPAKVVGEKVFYSE